MNSPIGWPRHQRPQVRSDPTSVPTGSQLDPTWRLSRWPPLPSGALCTAPTLRSLPDVSVRKRRMRRRRWSDTFTPTGSNRPPTVGPLTGPRIGGI